MLPLVPVVSAARAVCDAATGVPSLTTARALVASTVQRQLCTVEDTVVHYSPSAVDQPEWAADVGRWLRRRAADLGLPGPPA